MEVPESDYLFCSPNSSSVVAPQAIDIDLETDANCLFILEIQGPCPLD
jgi:hypothetical protein